MLQHCLNKYIKTTLSHAFSSSSLWPMKRARDNAVHQLLDLEATVGDKDEEDQEDEDNEDGFIEPDDPSINHHYTPSWRQLDNASDEEGGWDALIAALEERHGSKFKATPIAEDNDRNERPPIDPIIVSTIENITTHDYPFWRVRCKPGSAEAVVDFLCEMAAPQHEMRTAFVHGSMNCWVYLEATMNDHLRHLVEHAPGIICNQFGFHSEQVHSGDGLTLLKMHHASPLEVGKWVQVRKGVYKGDAGYITSTNSGGPGEVQLLLIPRLSQLQPGNPSHSCSAPTLFNCEAIKRLYNIEPVCIQENIYSFQGDRFEHGLISKSYAFNLISTTISCMPFESLSLFLESHHPALKASWSSFLKPSEWHFAEGDEVYIVDDSSSYTIGVISTLRSDSVEVSTEEGIICVPWLRIRKVIRQGDFIEVMGGMYLGQTGWVGELHELVESMDNAAMNIQMANIIKFEDKERSLSDHIQTFDVSINLLKCITVPHVLGVHQQDEGIRQSEQIPWINKEIVVVKDGHMFRTLKGTVKDVLCNQPTPSGLKLVVQMNSILAVPSITLDYDGVVEARTAVKLHEYAPPESKLFIPRNKTSGPTKLMLIQPPPNPVSSPSPGNATPIPKSSLSSSPAWDPSSRTPQPNSDNTESLPSPSSPLNTFNQLEGHPLLDLRLLDAQLKVFVTGGKFNKKELIASVHFIEGQLHIQHHFYKSWKVLLPEWVTPKYPNPTRDNGLLVIIKGDHCGKYVRRIHHHYKGTEAIVILAVVIRVAGTMDNLSGEQLELDVSHLCVCNESKEDKGLNRSLMDPLREEARKTRAK